MAAQGIDPRADQSGESARPVVARTRNGLPNWAIAAGILVAGLVLFLILDSRRRQPSSPTISARPGERRAGSEPSDLFVPSLAQPTPPAILPPPTPAPTASPAPPRVIYTPAPAAPRPNPAPLQPPRNSADPVLVIDTTANETIAGGGAPAVATGSAAPGGGDSAGAGALNAGRARASVLRNRSTTVPQGTLIPAVLETALDSTRPGPARGLVTRDVRGFDGSKVLIPRGSRLIGEYKADLQPGQNRALVIWMRLVRPDGVTIDLASPSADPLGRAGIKGSVNSHFLERFASALLQTSVSVGTSLAAGLGGNNNSIAVLALPGAGAGVGTALTGNEEIKRTLRVKQGVSVSVFVARDLDFTAVEARK